MGNPATLIFQSKIAPKARARSSRFARLKAARASREHVALDLTLGLAKANRRLEARLDGRPGPAGWARVEPGGGAPSWGLGSVQLVSLA